MEKDKVLFIQFLKKEKALSNYIIARNNWIKLYYTNPERYVSIASNASLATSEPIGLFPNVEKKNHYIKFAFSWEDSIQGFEYWFKLYKLYIDFLFNSTAKYDHETRSIVYKFNNSGEVSIPMSDLAEAVHNVFRPITQDFQIG